MSPDNDSIISALETTGKFEALREIPGGANAYAFACRHKHLNRDVFLKIYHFVEGMENDVLREPRSLVEATKDPSGCPNLVQVFDTDVITIGSERYVCLQMEFVHGESLLKGLQRVNIGQQDAIRIVSGISNGVAHLHSKQMLHRDLKPANILLDNMMPKIADFGSVAILQGDQSSVSASKHSALYVPPEGWKDPSIYTKASDLYQIGMVLYELVNGPLNNDDKHYLTRGALRQLKQDGKEFDSLDDFEKSRCVNSCIAELSIKGKLLEKGRPHCPYYSAKIARLVRVATQPDPQKRHGSVLEFLGALTKIDVPNWIASAENEFFAGSWRGWDWRLRIVQKRSRCDIVLERSRLDQQNWRRYPGMAFNSASDAFIFVENQ